jgi:hypothetical protein
MTDASMNFQARAPKIAPHILCIGMPVRDLTFRTPGVPARGSKENATHFEERAECGDRHRATWWARLDLRTDGRLQGNHEPIHFRADGT